MRLKDLDNDQLDELRVEIVFKMAEAEGRSPSYSEIADAGETVAYQELEREYGDIEFVPEDFGHCGKE